MSIHYLGVNKRDTPVEWYTHRYIFDALGCRFDLDPASPDAENVPWVPADRHRTVKDDGLRQPWAGCSRLNPPYGRKILPLWVEKFCQPDNGIILVPERTWRRWWQRLSSYSDLIMFVNPKIAFIPPSGKKEAAQAIGSTLAAVGEQGVAALENAHYLGRLLKPLIEGAA